MQKYNPKSRYSVQFMSRYVVVLILSALLICFTVVHLVCGVIMQLFQSQWDSLEECEELNLRNPPIRFDFTKTKLTKQIHGYIIVQGFGCDWSNLWGIWLKRKWYYNSRWLMVISFTYADQLTSIKIAEKITLCSAGKISYGDTPPGTSTCDMDK